MNCKECAHPLPVNAKFCPNCGQECTDFSSSEESVQRGGLSNLARGITKVAGVENPEGLKLSTVFSKVFVRHTEDEAENLFTVGTRETTPSIKDVIDTWPKPWLFARVFLLVAIAYFGLYIGLQFFQDPLFLPGLIILGAVMVPVTLLVFFWEMNAPQNISLYVTAKMVLIGGVLSLLVSLVFYQILGSGSTVAIGIVEEAAKVVAIVWFLKRRNYKFILNGLLIGACIGTGFATIETAGYALNGALNGGLQSMYSTIFLRAILAPGGHIVWAALSGAALCMVKGDHEFRWSMLRKFSFLRIFIIVVILHAVWDAFQFNGIPFVQIGLTVISWVIAFALMSAGLKEISRDKLMHSPLSEDAPATPMLP